MGVENRLSPSEVYEHLFKRLCALARSRQQAMRESIKSFGSTVTRATPEDKNELNLHRKSMGQSCSKLVLEIEAFQRWVAWARKAMADLGSREPSKEDCMNLRQWISEADISLWLLDPACRCMALVKSWGRTSMAWGPPRKLGFWVDELKMGVWLAGFRVFGNPLPNLTTARLQYYAEGSGEDDQFCVKNTFLDSAPRTQLRRSQSSSRQAGSAQTAITQCNFSETAERGTVSGAKTVDLEKEAANLKFVNLNHVSTAVVAAGSKANSLLPSSPQSCHFGRFSDKMVMDVVATPVKQRLEQPHFVEALPTQWTKGGSTTTTWWKQVPDICPISNFPVSLLPYPPFKLQTSCTNGEVGPRSLGVWTHLVDGCYLVVQVLSSMKFEALGQQLSRLDVQALDQYMKRCRLGHFRLTKALQLSQEGGVEATRALEVLRDQARRRLSSLRQIQRIRLARHSVA